MNENELEQIGNELMEEYGERLPCPLHCPKEFAYLLRLHLYYRHIKQQEE